MRQEVDDQLKKFTAKQLKKINSTLEIDSPEVLVKGLEAIVALMRNHEKASNIDVELYFKDLKKLTLKMERLDATKLTTEIVQRQHDQIKSVKD